MVGNSSGVGEYRGIGEVFRKEPIGAVVQILRRRQGAGGRWTFIRPFTSLPKDVVIPQSFVVMGAKPTTTVTRGESEYDARDLHPAFEAFNTCDPRRAQTLRCMLVHWDESKVFRKHLGAYQSPDGEKGSPKSGWWCKGDARRATRWDGREFCSITCAGRKCEFQQPNFGRHKVPLCRANLSFVAQFDWQNMPDGKPNPLPKILFQWNTKSWNNAGALDGMFADVQERAQQSGFVAKQADGTYEKFPVFGLRLTLSLGEHVQTRKGRRFPDVAVSYTSDILEWMATVQQYRLKKGALQLPDAQTGPAPLELMPPEGFTVEDMEDLSASELDPEYKPANERDRG